MKNSNESTVIGGGNLSSGVDPCLDTYWSDIRGADSSTALNKLTDCISPESRTGYWGWKQNGGTRPRLFPPAKECHECTIRVPDMDMLLDLLGLSSTSTSNEILAVKQKLDAFHTIIANSMWAYHQHFHDIPPIEDRIRNFFSYVAYNNIVLSAEDQTFLLSYLSILYFPNFVLPSTWYYNLYDVGGLTPIFIEGVIIN